MSSIESTVRYHVDTVTYATVSKVVSPHVIARKIYSAVSRLAVYTAKYSPDPEPITDTVIVIPNPRMLIRYLNVDHDGLSRHLYAAPATAIVSALNEINFHLFCDNIKDYERMEVETMINHILRCLYDFYQENPEQFHEHYAADKLAYSLGAESDGTAYLSIFKYAPCN